MVASFLESTLMDRRHILFGLAGATAHLLLRNTVAYGQVGSTTLTPSNYASETLQVGTLAKTTSQIALQNSTNQYVRRFALLEIAEQTAVAQSLTSNFNPPPALLNSQQQSIIQSLQAQSGSAFDTAYVQAQIQGHQELFAIQQQFIAADTDPTADFVHIALIAATSIETHLAILNGILLFAPG
jgi:putative membrane protein